MAGVRTQLTVPIGSIASMTTCSVLRCPETPTAVFKLMPGSNLEVRVCAGHKAVLKSGARWMVNGGTGSPSDEGTGPGLRRTGSMSVLASNPRT